MRIFFATIFSIIFGVSFLTTSALAGPLDSSMTKNIATESGFTTKGVTDTTISETVGGIIKTVLSFIGIIFLSLTVYAGILWMTAGGKEEQVEKATSIFRTSVIGLVIVIASYSITYFVMKYTFKVNSQSSPVGGSGPTVNKGAVDEFIKGAQEEMKKDGF